MLLDDDTITPTALAGELGVDPRQVRGWLRANQIGHVPLSGGVSQHRAGQLF